METQISILFQPNDDEMGSTCQLSHKSSLSRKLKPHQLGFNCFKTFYHETKVLSYGKKLSPFYALNRVSQIDSSQSCPISQVFDPAN